MPQSCLARADRAQLGLCQAAWQLWLGMCGGPAQLQALAQNPRASGQGLELTSPCLHAGPVNYRQTVSRSWAIYLTPDAFVDFELLAALLSTG